MHSVLTFNDALYYLKILTAMIIDEETMALLPLAIYTSVLSDSAWNKNLRRIYLIISYRFKQLMLISSHDFMAQACYNIEGEAIIKCSHASSKIAEANNNLWRYEIFENKESSHRHRREPSLFGNIDNIKYNDI